MLSAIGHLGKQLDTVGLFRLAGSTAAVKQITGRSAGTPIDWYGVDDPHVAVDTFKFYLKNFEGGLVPLAVQDGFRKLKIEPDENDKQGKLRELREMRALFQELPPENQKILGELLLHFSEVSRNGKKNLMTSSNLAIILGPHLINYSAAEFLDGMETRVSRLAKVMIDNADWIVG